MLDALINWYDERSNGILNALNKLIPDERKKCLTRLAEEGETVAEYIIIRIGLKRAYMENKYATKDYPSLLLAFPKNDEERKYKMKQLEEKRKNLLASEEKIDRLTSRERQLEERIRGYGYEGPFMEE